MVVVVFVNSFLEIDGNELFFRDFLTFFNYENPIFICSDEFDLDLSNSTNNSAISLISYTTNKDEEEIAYHISNLSEITTIVFMDKGHQNLLVILVNELQLFKRELTGLVPEADVTAAENLTLHLNTQMFIYQAKENSTILKEMYALNGINRIHTIGKWTRNTGLSVNSSNIWERRTDLEGMLIRVATLNFPCLHELHYDKLERSIVGGSGMFLEPLNIFANKLNFTFELIASIDGQFGAMDDNGTWNGLIGMLENDQADIAGASLYTTVARGKVITFGKGIVEGLITLVSGAALETETNTWIYIDIFPHSAWYLCSAMVLSMSICFVVMNYSGLNYMHDNFDKEKFTIINGFGLSLTFFRLIYYNVNISCLSTKILFFFSALSTYLLYAHYTAYLTAASTHVDKILPIHSFADVLKRGYQVSVTKNGIVHSYLRSSKPGTAMSKVYEKTVKNNPNALLPSWENVPEILASEKNLIYGDDMELPALYKGLNFLNIQGRFQLN